MSSVRTRTIRVIQKIQAGDWALFAEMFEALPEETQVAFHAAMYPPLTEAQVSEALDEIEAQLTFLGEAAAPIREAIEAARPGKPVSPGQGVR
jgi:hypothetical protein